MDDATRQTVTESLINETTTDPAERAAMYDEHDTSAMSNSRLRRNRQWRVGEAMAVTTFRSMPSGRTMPSISGRVIS